MGMLDMEKWGQWIWWCVDDGPGGVGMVEVEEGG